MVVIESKEDLQKYIRMLLVMLQDYPLAMTVEQVQEVLNIKEKQTYKKIRTGELPAMWIGNSYRVLKPEVIKYIVSLSLDLSQLGSKEETIDMLTKCCAA